MIAEFIAQPFRVFSAQLGAFRVVITHHIAGLITETAFPVAPTRLVIVPFRYEIYFPIVFLSFWILYFNQITDL
ncbi:hypothetical protein BUE93_20460 [Chromobacterium amazonense]|uniref:Uncharacterized protein n=1 Tax=Chromobacterium amazonense TaxID=1382803 RepID=A0A2S9WZC6_9NEIS|nr:hypothetical protein BUE93_20460 [Chromobacterium amazonense]